MKKQRHLLLPLLFVALLTTTGCKEESTFDGDLLVGKWVTGTEYWRYDADGTGATWDTGDDVQEEEAQPFTWEFDAQTSLLTQVHQMEMGGVIPKSYTITALDASKLEYKDRLGQVFSFNRVN